MARGPADQIPGRTNLAGHIVTVDTLNSVKSNVFLNSIVVPDNFYPYSTVIIWSGFSYLFRVERLPYKKHIFCFAIRPCGCGYSFSGQAFDNVDSPE
tara:strand:- start:406 stop:696 length:291 start_codon:yes stop_codon:yes gene_type:complete